MMIESYDFIVVGAGPGGCVVARRLAESVKRPSVLLVEAGSDNRSHKEYMTSEGRFTLAFTEPKINWNYDTIEQPQLHNHCINHARGKGLGGSTGINFCVWLVGSNEDYNEWATLTGDDAWQWSAVNKRLRRIENVHQDAAPENLQFLEPFNHSTDGNVDVSYAKAWDPNIEVSMMNAAKQMGWPVTHDLNSGNPIGVGVAPSTYWQGSRVTAASAYLSNVPENLTILPDTAVASIQLENKNATGILTVDGLNIHARHEVVLAAGSLNTPQILMLSGIGPSAELSKHNITINHDLPGVGQHLIDHLHAPITQLLTPAAASNTVDPNADPNYQCGEQPAIGFLRLPTLANHPLTSSLPQHTQDKLSQPTVPNFEILTAPLPAVLGTYTLQPGDKFRSIDTFIMNPQSQGSVKLASSNPQDAPIIDGNYLSHPYDQRVAIEALRATMQLQSQPAFAQSTQSLICAPRSLADEDLLEYFRENAGSVWHMAGTTKMGKFDDEDDLVCVDPDFRVRGLQGLRVADMSVAPTLPCNHTQTTAYLIGETAAEKLIAEYGLDSE